MRTRVISILLAASLLCFPAQAQYRSSRTIATRTSTRTVSQRTSGRQMIYQYAQNGNLRGLKALQSRGYALDVYDANGNSALCEAVLRKDKRAAETLIAAGANQNAPCMQKIPVENKQAAGTKVTILKTTKTTFNDIYKLASEQNKEELEKMRSCGVNLDMMNMQGNTAYCQALIDENCEAYTTLREVGVNTDHNCVRRLPRDQQTLNCESCTACLWVGLGAAALIGAGVGLAAGGGGGGSDDSPAIVCPDGYHAEGGSCVPNDCTGFPLNACPVGAAGDCAQCQSGDVIWYKANSCTAGYHLVDGTCVENDCSGFPLTSCPAAAEEDCSRCQTGDVVKWKANHCKNGWVLRDGVCVENTCTRGATDIAHCTTKTEVCREGDTPYYICSQCEEGYDPDGETVCVPSDCSGFPLSSCPAAADGDCTQCKSGDVIKWKANSCQNGWELVDGECVENTCTEGKTEILHCEELDEVCRAGDTPYYLCDLCETRYYSNTAHDTCTECSGKTEIAHCAEYNAPCSDDNGTEYKTCKVCDPGYHTDDGLECVEDPPVEVIYVQKFGANVTGQVYTNTEDLNNTATGLGNSRVGLEVIRAEGTAINGGDDPDNPGTLIGSITMTSTDDSTPTYGMKSSVADAGLINKTSISATIDNSTGTSTFYGMYSNGADNTVTNDDDAEITIVGSVVGSASEISHVAGMETTTSDATNDGDIAVTLTQKDVAPTSRKFISAFGMFTSSGDLTNNGTLTISADRYANGMSNEGGTDIATLINTGEITVVNTNAEVEVDDGAGGTISKLKGDKDGARAIGIYANGTAINRGTINASSGDASQTSVGMVSGSDDQHAAVLSGVELTNEGNINVTTSAYQDGYGMATLMSRTASVLTNTSTGRITLNYTGGSVGAGIYSEMDGTVLNNGIVVVTGNDYNVQTAGGIITGANGAVTNNGSITVTNAAQESYGIYVGEGSNVTNKGTITVSVSSDYTAAYGIYSQGNGGTIINDEGAVISVSNASEPDDAYGIYVADGTTPTTVINKGTIIINGSGPDDLEHSCTGNACNVENYIRVGEHNTFVSSGLIQGLSMNVDNIDGNFVAGKGAVIDMQDSLSGNLNISSDLTTSGFEKAYVGEGMIQAGDTTGLNLVSNSALFDASLADNGHDVVMQMKDFDDVVENNSLANFLEANYAAGNNETLFNRLKEMNTVSAFNNALDKMTGREMLTRFAFEDLTMMKELNFSMNNNLFNKEGSYFSMAESVSSPMAFKGDKGSNSRYSLMNRREGSWSLGMGVAFTDIRSDNEHNKDGRDDSVYQLVVPVGYRTHGFNFMVSPRIGYAYGTYDRTGFDGSTYDGTVEKRIFGLMNEVRYPVMLGSWRFEPAVEFNALGYEQTGSEEAKELSLVIPKQRTYSVESGLGLYATRELENEDGSKLTLTAGVAGYHEFADPYKVEVGIRGMDGRIMLRDDRRTKNRAVARAGFEFDEGDYSIYGNVISYIDSEVRSKAKLGLKYAF